MNCEKAFLLPKMYKKIRPFGLVELHKIACGGAPARGANAGVCLWWGGLPLVYLGQGQGAGSRTCCSADSTAKPNRTEPSPICGIGHRGAAQCNCSVRAAQQGCGHAAVRWAPLQKASLTQEHSQKGSPGSRCHPPPPRCAQTPLLYRGHIKRGAENSPSRAGLLKQL